MSLFFKNRVMLGLGQIKRDVPRISGNFEIICIFILTFLSIDFLGQQLMLHYLPCYSWLPIIGIR